MTVEKVIPILRIFDYKKAMEFYFDWLGFKNDWDHTFEENTPIYMQISLNELVIHLSEHHGDSSPGTRVCVGCSGLKECHQLLVNKNYKYDRPGLEKSFYKTWCMEVIDPFGNRLTFNQKIDEEK